MTTLLIKDNSAVAKSIAKIVSEESSLTETAIESIDTVKGSTFDSIIVSSHQFAYDKDLDDKKLLELYNTDVVQFGNILENSHKYLQSGGKVIVILSMDCINGSFASKHYNSIHAARKSLIQSHGNTLAQKGISINGIALGWIEDVLETETGEKTAKIKSVARKFNPLNRLGNPEEVAELVTGLLKIKTQFLNGHIINFDGGQINSDPVNQKEWELLVK